VSTLLVDLSNNNGTVDFARLAKVPGIVGVYLKATEGRTFTDWTFHERRLEAERHGLRVGAYHFARFGLCRDEAEHFAHVAGACHRRDLRPALDAEVGSGHGLAGWSREWVRRVWQLTGTLPIFYSFPAWIEAARPDEPIGAALWLAAWGRNDGTEHPYSVPRPWRHVAAHQFTSEGRVPGVTGFCDVSSVRSIRPLLAHPIAGRL
jgi:lysozyme